MVGASEKAPRPNDSDSPPAVGHAKRCRFRPSSFDALETRFTTPKRAETSDNEKAQAADADHGGRLRLWARGSAGLDDLEHGRAAHRLHQSPHRHERYHSPRPRDDEWIRQLLGECEAREPRV